MLKKDKQTKPKNDIPQGKRPEYDVDEAIKSVLAKENLPEGTMIYDPKAIHPMNPEFLDEFVDEDDPGFDTYVVNEENFVASC